MVWRRIDFFCAFVAIEIKEADYAAVILLLSLNLKQPRLTEMEGPSSS
jgi:hypothetical protein